MVELQIEKHYCTKYSTVLSNFREIHADCSNEYTEHLIVSVRVFIMAIVLYGNKLFVCQSWSAGIGNGINSQYNLPI